MAIRFGAGAVAAIKYGTTQVQRIYHGTVLVFQYAFLQSASRVSNATIVNSAATWADFVGLTATASGTVMSGSPPAILCQSTATYTVTAVDVRSGAHANNGVRIVVNGTVVATQMSTGTGTIVCTWTGAITAGQIVKAQSTASTVGSAARTQTQAALQLEPAA